MKAIRLHDYQKDIKQRLAEAWQRHRSVMVQMPTGTGKTHVLAAVVNEETSSNEECRMKNEEFAAAVENGGYKIKVQANEESPEQVNDGSPAAAGKPRPVYIIAHRRELVAQIEETVGRFGIGTEGGRVRVMSIQWLSRHWEEMRTEAAPGLVIIDEAHHAVAETYREMWIRWPEARFLGLTATPCRMNRRGFTALFDTLVTSWSIAEFIGKKYLSAFDYVSIRPGSEEQRLVDSLGKRGADGDYQIKEMDARLNRSTTIGRLYRSMERFAAGKKGIVYAVSIGHARSIATYYNNKGVASAAIDSRTPAAERRQLVENFKAGRVQVLVNVDIFSEGFDCPDVEFIQLARPTLSLAKYLQQVGRGLRKTAGKETCVLIDNVGLYRVFGLPTAAWDWDAMFRGDEAGKGRPAAGMYDPEQALAAQVQDGRMQTARPAQIPEHEEPASDCDMEVIIAHDRLLDACAAHRNLPPARRACEERLAAWHDVHSGLWGLRRGMRHVTPASYPAVFGVRDDMAAVRLKDRCCGLTDASGVIVWKTDNCRTMRFARNHLLEVEAYDGTIRYLDLRSLHVYDRRPEIKRFGSVELLKVGRTYYSRTKKVYETDGDIGRGLISSREFYAAIYDCRPLASGAAPLCGINGGQCAYACILAGDYDWFYWMCRWLADGSIIMTDGEGRYYHAGAGSGKVYIGCDTSEEDGVRCRAEIERLTVQAKAALRSVEAGKAVRRRLIAGPSAEAVPFRSGMKWGLRIGNRVTVPPVYRMVRPPVGKYCAVEKNYSQWGIMALDGTWVVEPQYSDIDISAQGTFTGTKVTGAKVCAELP